MADRKKYEYEIPFDHINIPEVLQNYPYTDNFLNSDTQKSISNILDANKLYFGWAFDGCDLRVKVYVEKGKLDLARTLINPNYVEKGKMDSAKILMNLNHVEKGKFDLETILMNLN